MQKWGARSKDGKKVSVCWYISSQYAINNCVDAQVEQFSLFIAYAYKWFSHDGALSELCNVGLSNSVISVDFKTLRLMICSTF